VAETRPEHFDHALDDGKVSTNVYLRRIHNHALGMEWLLKSVIPRLQWPKPVFKNKRAITAAEHAAIIQREQNAERRDFYELLPLALPSRTLGGGDSTADSGEARRASGAHPRWLEDALCTDALKK
jgi:hypothetical protein